MQDTISRRPGRTALRFLVAGLMITPAAAALWAGPASAHAIHHVKTGNGGTQQLANDRNHGAVDFVSSPGLALFCVDAGEALNSGNTLSGAMYGIETAHHGPDAQGNGLSDGCYATTTPITDNNPAID